LGECIGKGGFGRVYRALNTQTGDFVAVKQFDVSQVPKKEMQAIMREMETMKGLHHENIVQFMGYVKEKEYLSLILEYIENGSLTNILKTFGTFPEELVRVYTKQVLQGLEYLHSCNVLHRDIKGCNILITKAGLVKLADFGVSATLNEQEKRFSVVGTPYWMAPEVVEMTGQSFPSDIWSVGCTVVELITGEPPYFELQSMQALFKIVSDPHPPLPDNITQPLQQFLLKCWDRDCAKRPTATALLSDPWVCTPQQSLTRAVIARSHVQGDLSDDSDDENVFDEIESQKKANQESEQLRRELAEQRKQNETMQTQLKELRSKLLLALEGQRSAIKLAQTCLQSGGSDTSALRQELRTLMENAGVRISTPLSPSPPSTPTAGVAPQRPPRRGDPPSSAGSTGAGTLGAGTTSRPSAVPSGAAAGETTVECAEMLSAGVENFVHSQEWIDEHCKKIAAETLLSAKTTPWLLSSFYPA